MNGTKRAPIAADRLRIRHVEPADYEGVHASMSTPLAYAGTLQLPMIAKEQWRKKLIDFGADSTLLVAEVDESTATGASWRIVGSAGLQSAGPSPRRRHVAGLGIAIHDDWQGRGIGTALMHALIDRADHWMNLLRIELTVFTDNDGARALYERFGFVVEGTQRAYALRAGVYADVHAMARLHPRPPSLPVAVEEP